MSENRNALDLSNFAQKESAEMQVRHPITGEPLFHPPAAGEDKGDAVCVDVLSRDSEIYKARARDRLNARLSAAEGKRDVFPNAADIEDTGTGILVDLTLNWNIVIDGVCPDPKDKAAVAKVYSDPRFGWLREQVDVFAGARANFIKGSRAS